MKELFVEHPCETYSTTKVKVNRNETEVKECMIFSTLFLVSHERLRRMPVLQLFINPRAFLEHSCLSQASKSDF